MRTELSTLYRTQAAAQNKQLAMADALRDRDEEVRGLREEVRELRDARDGGTRRERNWEERWRMRDEDVKVRTQAVGYSRNWKGSRLYRVLSNPFADACLLFFSRRRSTTRSSRNKSKSRASHSVTRRCKPTTRRCSNAGSTR